MIYEREHDIREPGDLHLNKLQFDIGKRIRYT